LAEIAIVISAAELKLVVGRSEWQNIAAVLPKLSRLFFAQLSAFSTA
jgi:citrate lyase synthetase